MELFLFFLIIEAFVGLKLWCCPPLTPADPTYASGRRCSSRCAPTRTESAREVERKYDLTPKSAWFMLHRIREAMKQEPLAGMLRGVIVADEAYIGGARKNKHQQGKKGRKPNAGQVSRRGADTR
jgi:hypothetical protein